mgnify:FL=1
MENAKQVVVLRLGDARYGIPIDQVNEIIRYIAPARIPKAPGYMEGIISLRGKVLAAVNLRTLLGMDKKEADENTKIIIAGGSNMGFIVDDVDMIVTPGDDETDSAAGLPGYIDGSFVTRILKINGEIIIVLNMASMLNMGEKAKAAV